MREVEASAFVMARPPAVHRALSPESVVAAEGTFEVTGVEEVDGDTEVVAAAPGVTVLLRFQGREDGLAYVAEGAVGPFEHLETEVTVAPERNGSRLTMRSTVSLNLPLPFADRIAAWKRRGELRRAVETLADSVA
jgi:ligand-binding SRPBCC domain-containing protein